MLQPVGGCASQAVCVFASRTVGAAFAESDFRGKLDVFDSYMQSPFLESLPKIPNVVTAWLLYLLCPAQRESREVPAGCFTSVRLSLNVE